jgi:ATP dependent DNA ligase domain
MPSVLNKRLSLFPTRSATFVEPMECLGVAKLPDGAQWLYEIKLDGYRAQAINSDGNLILFSRRRKSFNRLFPLIVEALGDLPENTSGGRRSRCPGRIRPSRFQPALELSQRSLTHPFLRFRYPNLLMEGLTQCAQGYRTEISTTMSNSGCLESADAGSLIGRFAVKAKATINEPTLSSFQHELT